MRTRGYHGDPTPDTLRLVLKAEGGRRKRSWPRLPVDTSNPGTALSTDSTLFPRKGVQLFRGMPPASLLTKDFLPHTATPLPPSPCWVSRSLSISLVNPLLLLLKVGGEGPRRGGSRSRRWGDSQAAASQEPERQEGHEHKCSSPQENASAVDS